MPSKPDSNTSKLGSKCVGRDQTEILILNHYFGVLCFPHSLSEPYCINMTNSATLALGKGQILFSLFFAPRPPPRESLLNNLVKSRPCFTNISIVTWEDECTEPMSTCRGVIFIERYIFEKGPSLLNCH